jgi:hypothetical protein
MTDGIADCEPFTITQIYSIKVNHLQEISMKIRILKFLLSIFTFGILSILLSCRNKESKNASGELSYGFSRVDKNIFYYGKIMQNVDAESFMVLDENFCKDKTQVFYHNTYRESKDYFTSKQHYIVQLDNADAFTFSVLGYGYAKDTSTAWHKEKQFEVSDIQSLNAVDLMIVKDKNHVYVEGKKVAGCDGASFERINNFYARDNKRYYHISGDMIEFRLKPVDCDYKTYELLDYTYSRDKNNVFYNGEKIPGASSFSFQLINPPYSKDHQYIFYENSILVKADPATFELFRENENSLGETYYARDKNKIFINEYVFEKADVATFRIFNEKYCSDKNGVYFRSKKIKTADITSFKVYPHFIGNADAEDKNHKYGDGNIVD